MADEERSLFDRWNDDGQIYNNEFYLLFPLGKLSKKQIQKGMDVLNKISLKLNTEYDRNEIINLSNVFYSTIPHLSEFIIIIDNFNILNEKYKRLEYMNNY